MTYRDPHFTPDHADKALLAIAWLLNRPLVSSIPTYVSKLKRIRKFIAAAQRSTPLRPKS